MAVDDLPQFEGLPRSRRVNMPYKTGRIGFSVPEGVTDEQAISEIERALHAVAEGKSREIVNLDGNHTTSERFKVAWVYLRSWSIRGWRATFGRAAVSKEKAEISRLLRPAEPLQPK